MDALCFLFSKQRVWENRWEPRDASQVPQRWIDQNSSESSLRLNWPHWSGVIFPAGWAGSLHYCASSRGTSVRSEAVAPLTAAALTVSKAHIACRAKCQVSGLACAYAMGAAAYPAIWTDKQVFLAGKVSVHPPHLWFVMHGARKMTAGVNVCGSSAGWSSYWSQSW